MPSFFAEILIRLYGPIHGVLLKCLAYGPWGPLHRLMISIFKSLYGIEWHSPQRFANLGAFFLRRIPFEVGKSDLVSPVQAEVVEYATSLNLSTETRVKGIQYSWKEFPELDLKPWSSGRFWNLYLTPRHYHWVHAPCSGIELKAYRTSGLKWPVNAWGRRYCPDLYLRNDRLTFSWQSEKFGQIYLICVGAMGVSSLKSVKGDPGVKGQWTPIAPNVAKGEALLAFELGSTVLLLVERPPSFVNFPTMVQVGHDL